MAVGNRKGNRVPVVDRKQIAKIQLQSQTLVINDSCLATNTDTLKRCKDHAQLGSHRHSI